MEKFDYSELKYIEKVQGNYISLKNGGSMHCIDLDIKTQEDLEMQDLEIGRLIDLIKKKKEKNKQ